MSVKKWILNVVAAAGLLTVAACASPEKRVTTLTDCENFVDRWTASVGETPTPPRETSLLAACEDEKQREQNRQRWMRQEHKFRDEA